mmetsp:Transcript_15117/g.44125  ORF Transcript_15117/g.44125 Transcript_15117/m.44125 type:complete len:221 (-) Transcript_15117:87-749(-)
MFSCISTAGLRHDDFDGEEILAASSPADMWKRYAAEERSYHDEEEKQKQELQKREREAQELRRAEDQARQHIQELANQVKEAQRAYKEEQARYEQLRREREISEHTAAARHSEAKRMLQERERWVRKTAVSAFLKENGFSAVNAPKRSLLRTTFALHAAAEAGNARMVEMLLREGADLGQLNSSGSTALQAAREVDDKDSHARVLRVLTSATRAHARGGA